MGQAAETLVLAALPVAVGCLALAASRRRALRGERGQSCVELALILPVFLLVFSAAVEFGVVIADGVSLSGAARDGARAGAAVGLTSTQAVQQAASVATEAATGLVNCALQSPQATYDTGSTGDVTVTVSCDYTPLTPLGPLVAAFLGGGGDEPSTLAATESWRINR